MSNEKFDSPIIGATQAQLAGFEDNLPIEGGFDRPAEISPSTNDPSPDTGAVALDVAALAAEFGAYKTEVNNHIERLEALINQHVNALNDTFAARIANLEVTEK